MNSRSFFSIKAHHQGASPSLPSEEMVRLELWPPATNAPPTAGAKDRTRSSSSSPVDGDDTDDDGDDTDDDVDDDEVCLFFFLVFDEATTWTFQKEKGSTQLLGSKSSKEC